MAKVVRTTMYSVAENGDVIVHRFPWDYNDLMQRDKLRRFEKMGYTYEDPRRIVKVIETAVVEEGEELEKVSEAVVIEESIMMSCPECGRECKGAWGLQQHMRKHNPDGVKRGRKKRQ